MARTFAPIVLNQPTSQPVKIRRFVLDAASDTDMHPVYQRDIKWSSENMCDLISTIMYSGIIPGIMLYKYQRDDERSVPSYQYECIDGQHRIFAITHYFNSEPVVLPGKKPFFVFLRYKDVEGRETHVFYKENEATQIWAAANRDKRIDYMTEEEQTRFNDFALDIREIKDKLTLNQRRELFTSLQKGIPVRGSDLYKNMVKCPLVAFITEKMGWEKQTCDLLRDHLTLNIKAYWIHWVIRLFLIQKADTEEARVKAFMVRDGEISKCIKTCDPRLNITEEEEPLFEMAVTRFFAAFDTEELDGVKLSPTHFYALYTHLLDATEEREALVLGHIKAMIEPLHKKYKGMWDGRKIARGVVVEEKQRADYFARVLDQLNTITTPAVAAEVKEFKNIPKQIRERVWSKAFGEAKEGTCHCCKKKIDTEHWEQGHIVARACGGKDDASNLRPVCQKCNRSMGVENMDAFKARCYPE